MNASPALNVFWIPLRAAAGLESLRYIIIDGRALNEIFRGVASSLRRGRGCGLFGRRRGRGDFCGFDAFDAMMVA